MPVSISPSEPPEGSPHIVLRPPTPRDGAAIWALAREVGLDLNSPYAYVMWGDHFAGASVVAERSGAARPGDAGPVAGFVAGFLVPDRPDTVFVWQVGVAPAQRGRGLGGRMLRDVVARTGARWMEATVTPSNTASAALFSATARRFGAPLTVEPAYGADLFPGDHEPELRYRLGPFAGTTDRARDQRT